MEFVYFEVRGSPVAVDDCMILHTELRYLPYLVDQ